MQFRILTTGAVGLALALSAAAAEAQVPTDTTRRDSAAVRSTRSIPVRKDMTTTESTGAVADTTTPAPAPVDTTPAPAPVDTTPAPAPVDTTTAAPVQDTTTLVVAPAPIPEGPVAGGWYFGLGGGASVPSGDFGDAFSTGWNAGALLGWRPANGIVGVRLDANYNRMSAQDSPLLSSSDQATIWSGMLDLTLDFPLGQNGSSFYLLGGGGVHNMTMDIEGIDEDIDLDATKLGVNAGAGLSFAMGRTNLFVEGRFVNVFSGDDGDDNPFNDDDRRYIPIMAGLKWHF